MPFLGELSALFTACLWSGSAMVFASATKLVGSFQVNITRLILAAVYLVLLIAVFQFDVRLSSTQILNLGLSGVVGLTLGDTFLFKAFQKIGARVSMLIMSVAPAVAAILAYFVLGETLSAVGILGIITTVFGVSIVVLDRGAVASQRIVLTTTGLIYAALAAAGQGGGLVLAKMAFQEGNVNGFVASAVRIIASLVVLLPIAVMTNRYKSPVRMFSDDRKAFWLTALGSVFGPFLGISFSLIAIEYTKVGIAATIMATVPILMLPLLRFIYKEKLTWRAVVGAFVAVGGVAMLFLR
jgi:drug/metabolite transporter (DMT)-like permease